MNKEIYGDKVKVSPVRLNFVELAGALFEQRQWWV
ncbi:hypothetical protein JOC34_003468 [Virgibacillus halotolerans]|nr:hypothetical protein [Virgibacillus halotolerans]